MRDLLLRLRRDFPAVVLPAWGNLRRASRLPADPRRSLRPSPNRSSTNRLSTTLTLDFDRLGASRFDVPASVHLELDGTSEFLHLPASGYLHTQRFGTPYLYENKW